MTVWVWIGVGIAAFLALSLLVALGIARILGRIGEEIARIQEVEPWASAPLTREDEEQAETEPRDRHAAPHADDRRSRSSNS